MQLGHKHSRDGHNLLPRVNCGDLVSGSALIRRGMVALAIRVFINALEWSAREVTHKTEESTY